MFLTKEQAIDCFRRALLSVSADYCRYMRPGGGVRYGERVFAYELYHQMRMCFNQAYFVHGEFVKGLRLIPSTNRFDTMIPDLVVHQPGTLESNLIAVEIKVAQSLTATDLIKDFEKLEFYTRPHIKQGLDFKIGILVVVNSDVLSIISRTSFKNKTALRDLVSKGPRVAIWNVAEPLNHPDSNERQLMDPSCLCVFRANDILSILDPVKASPS